MHTTAREGPERAFLVGIEFRAGRRANLAHARLARDSARAAGPARIKEEDANDDISLGFDLEESMAEFRELAASAGANVVGESSQRRDKPDPATLIGKGKLAEISDAAAAVQADIILFDHDLSPSQQRNIEKEISVRVIDRTQLILDIFARTPVRVKASCRSNWRNWNTCCRA